MSMGFTWRKRAAVAAVAGAAAAALTLAGPAGASPIVAHGAARVTGTEHFQIMTTSATSSTASVIAWGVFTAGGVDHQGNSVDTFVFPGGTVKVKHSPGTGPQTFNPKTCLMTISLHGTYTVQGGSGKFKGITGHGKYTASIIFIGAKNKAGKCSQTAAPVAFQQVIDATGPVTLP
jgi:hypothetical protein